VIKPIPTPVTTDRFGVYKDLFIQTDVHFPQQGKYWEAGLLFRGVNNNGVYQFFMCFFINSDGKWNLPTATNWPEKYSGLD